MARGGYITLDPSRGYQVQVLIPSGSEPERGGGVGGWQSSDRALRRPAKWFASIPDDTYTINGILDLDAVIGPSIETRLDRLRAMGEPGSRDEPPTIKLLGDVWERDKSITWVLTDMTLGARQWTEGGKLRQQTVTLSLERYNGLDEIEAIRTRATRQHGHRRRHTVKSRTGDTLRSIALRELGSAGRWKDLRRWNKKLRKVDPDQRLRAGTHVAVR